MSCSFDKDRPCDSKNRKPNRYTRKEIEDLAEKCKIPDFKNKSMDELCKEVAKSVPNPVGPTVLDAIFEPIPNPKPVKIPKISYTVPVKPYPKSFFDVHPQEYRIFDLTVPGKINPENFEPLYLVNTKKRLSSYIMSYVRLIASIYNAKGKSKKQLLDDLFYKIVMGMKLTKKDLEHYGLDPLLDIANHLLLLNTKTYSKSKLIDAILGSDKEEIIKECPKNSKYALRPNYECNKRTGKWTRIKGSLDYYFKKQLLDKDLSELEKIASKLKIPIIPDKNKLIQEILEAQYPLVSSSSSDKYNKYIKKFKDYFLTKLYSKSGSISPINFNVDYCTCNALNFKKFFTHKPFNFPYVYKSFTLYGSDVRNKSNIVNDGYGIKNNIGWFQKQSDYQKNLPDLDKLTILAYTYGGDVMLHNWLNKTFDIKKAFNDTYITIARYMYPLFPALVEFCSDKKNKKQFLDDIKSGTDKEKKAYWDMCHKTPYDKYQEIITNIFKNVIMKDMFYEKLLQIFYNNLNKIILGSPPLDDSLIVYKGIKSYDFLKFNLHNIYKNERFISTSLQYQTAMSSGFSDIVKKCCLLKFYLLKGTRCLFPIFSYFSEYEILLPVDRYMYATSTMRKIKEKNNFKMMNVVIAN